VLCYIQYKLEQGKQKGADMKISLRKANAIQAAIIEAVNSLELATDVAINEFERPTEKIEEAVNKFSTNLVTRSKLMGVQYEIRRAVARANAEAGINDLLADVAMLEKDISLYTRLAKVRPALENDVIVGKLGKIKGRSEDQFYGRDDVVQTSIFNESAIDAFKSNLASLKKQKVSLQDSLLELNVQTEIEVSDDSEKLLARAGII
jgi:hypothetical protein